MKIFKIMLNIELSDSDIQIKFHFTSRKNNKKIIEIVI